MKMAIIADDLTGANDAGVKFAGRGMKTAVFFDATAGDMADYEVVCINTDSRSVSPDLAYKRTKSGLNMLKQERFDFYYKKIDSTMRGNVGAELDAFYDVLKPRFIFVAPSYPAYNRFVKDGYLFIGDRLLHLSEYARDPKTPVSQSYVPFMIEAQSARKVGTLSASDCEDDPERLLALLDHFYQHGQTNVLFNAESEQQLKKIAEWGRTLPFPIVWAGSAGLAEALAPEAGTLKMFKPSISAAPVLIVIGSVHPQSRKQAENVAKQPGICPIRLDSAEAAGAGSVPRKEVERILTEAGEAIQQNRDIVLFSAGERAHIEQAKLASADGGLDDAGVSDRIAEALGVTAAAMIHRYGIERVVLTGGDTARKVCSHIGIHKFELAGEVEPGVPFGRLIGDAGTDLYGITKAGGFGTDQVLQRSLSMLKGMDEVCGQS